MCCHLSVGYLCQIPKLCGVSINFVGYLHTLWGIYKLCGVYINFVGYLCSLSMKIVFSPTTRSYKEDPIKTPVGLKKKTLLWGPFDL